MFKHEVILFKNEVMLFKREVIFSNKAVILSKHEIIFFKHDIILSEHIQYCSKHEVILLKHGVALLIFEWRIRVSSYYHALLRVLSSLLERSPSFLKSSRAFTNVFLRVLVLLRGNLFSIREAQVFATGLFFALRSPTRIFEFLRGDRFSCYEA